MAVAESAMKSAIDVEAKTREILHSVYERVSLADMVYEESDRTFYYSCPCGDLFELTVDEISKGLRVATCPSCSLQIEVVITQKELEGICFKRTENATN